jgi:hypothetical protein
MKIAVINFSGNVGKTTVARHLLLPRIPGARLISVESLNADGEEAQALRGRQFGELQEYLQTVKDVVVDIGASNVEDLLGLMRRYHGSQEDFDCYVVPTVPALKQQSDTIATLVELGRLGIPAQRVRLVFNMVEDCVELEQAFHPLLSFLAEQALATVRRDCWLAHNEIHARLRGAGGDIGALARDDTDYKALIGQASSTHDKLALAQALATRRLAVGVLPRLDACFAALCLDELG